MIKKNITQINLNCSSKGSVYYILYSILRVSILYFPADFKFSLSSSFVVISYKVPVFF